LSYGQIGFALSFASAARNSTLLSRRRTAKRQKVAWLGNASNRLGLFDMHGNVEEWCDDDLGEFMGIPQRPHRGGSFNGTGIPTISSKISKLSRGNMRGLRVARVPRPPKEHDWVPLFNGKNLDGWKTHPSKAGGWTVEGKELVGRGSGSFPFSERSDYDNFHFRVEAQTNENANAGQVFRTPFAAADKGGVRGRLRSRHRRLCRRADLL
jgi:3-keto-disaccharide hydrolase/sulfatase-modifying factor enzyme 1